MPTIVTGNILECVFYCRYTSQTAANVRHYACVSHTGIGIDQLSIMETISGAIGLRMRDCISQNAQYYGMKATIIIPVGQAPLVTEEGRAVGNISGDVLPPQTAGLLTLRTGLIGRSARGRMYIPFPAEPDNILGAVPSTAYVLAANILAAQVLLARSIVAPNGGTLEPCIWSRKTGTRVLLLSATARDKWATQRRRSLINRGDGIPF